MKDGVCWFGGGGGRRLDGLSGILGGGVIWLWCKWGMDWRRGCGKIRGWQGKVGQGKGRWRWLSAPR